jgi:hypothetical protein
MNTFRFAFVKCPYSRYSMLLKILPFVLYTSPLSVQALQSRSCPAYLSHATTATQLGRSSDIVSERTQQKTPFLCWCGWCGITCSIAAALSNLCGTSWQHRFPQLSYCCVTSPRTWRVPLLRVQSLLMLISCLLCRNLVTALYMLQNNSA